MAWLQWRYAESWQQLCPVVAVRALRAVSSIEYGGRLEWSVSVANCDVRRTQQPANQCTTTTHYHYHALTVSERYDRGRCADSAARYQTVCRPLHCPTVHFAHHCVFGLDTSMADRVSVSPSPELRLSAPDSRPQLSQHNTHTTRAQSCSSAAHATAQPQPHLLDSPSSTALHNYRILTDTSSHSTLTSPSPLILLCLSSLLPPLLVHAVFSRAAAVLSA